jgi:phospholipase/carboxylesterase
MSEKRPGTSYSAAVFLHGVGATAASFEGVARALAPALPGAVLLTPDGFHPFDQMGQAGPGGGPGRQWFSVRGVTEANRPARVRQAGEQVGKWIDHELETRKLAPERLAIVGFSQGAIVAAWLAVHRKPSPLAVVMFSGRVADDAVPVARSTSASVLIAHGAEDPIMPVSLVEPGARALQAWGAHVTTRIYPGLGHQVDARELEDARAFLATRGDKG